MNVDITKEGEQPTTSHQNSTASSTFPSYSQFGPVDDFLPLPELFDGDSDCAFTTQFSTNPHIGSVISILEASGTQRWVKNKENTQSNSSVTTLPPHVSAFVTERLLPSSTSSLSSSESTEQTRFPGKGHSKNTTAAFAATGVGMTAKKNDSQHSNRWISMDTVIFHYHISVRTHIIQSIRKICSCTL